MQEMRFTLNLSVYKRDLKCYKRYLVAHRWGTSHCVCVSDVNGASVKYSACNVLPTECDNNFLQLSLDT